MLPGYPFRIGAAPLFCPACKHSTLHERWAEEALTIGAQGNAPVPLLCVCNPCGRQRMLPAAAFRDLQPLENRTNGFKIAGLSRIVAGDKVYFPETRKKGKVNARFRQEGSESLSLRPVEENEKPFDAVLLQPDAELSVEPYRLFPEEVEAIAVGDRVYDTHKNLSGHAIGMEYAPWPTLTVAWEKGDMENTPKSGQPASPDAEIYSALRELMVIRNKHAGLGNRRSDKRTEKRIVYRVLHGIVSLEGICESYREGCNLSRQCREIPGVLGVLNYLAPAYQSGNSDTKLHFDILEKLVTGPLPIAHIKVSVKKGRVTLTGKVVGPLHQSQVESHLGDLPGMRSLVCGFESESEAGESDRRKETDILAALKRDWMGIIALQVHTLPDGLCLDGLIASASQKHLAGLSAAWAARNFKIINNLTIVDKAWHP